MELELTRAADYAIRVMVELSAADGRRRSVRELAASEHIPQAFLPQVMAAMVAAGLVAGHQGRTGGYVLARPATAITMLQVIEAVEGDPRRTRCVLRGGACRAEGPCAVHEVFEAAQTALLATLGSATLDRVRTSSAPRARGPKVTRHRAVRL